MFIPDAIIEKRHCLLFNREGHYINGIFSKKQNSAGPLSEEMGIKGLRRLLAISSLSSSFPAFSRRFRVRRCGSGNVDLSRVVPRSRASPNHHVHQPEGVGRENPGGESAPLHQRWTRSLGHRARPVPVYQPRYISFIYSVIKGPCV